MPYKISHSNKFIITFFASTAGMIVNYAINFFLAPYIANSLGMEAYGFVSIANNFVNYAGIATMAITSFMVRYISVSYHSGNIKEANEYFSSSIFSCFFVSGIILLFVLILSWKLEYILNIPNDLLHDVKILFIFVFITFILNVILTPYSSAVYIRNRLDLSAIFKIFSYITQAISLIFLFQLFDSNISYVGYGSCISAIVLLVLNAVSCQKLVPELSFNFINISIKKIKSLVKNGIWDAFNQLGNVLNSGLDLLVSNLLLSGTETGEVSVAKTMGTMYAGVLSMISHLFQPTLIKSYASGNKEYFVTELGNAMKICGFFSNLIFAGFFSVGLLYYKLWMPEENIKLLYGLTIITFANYITDGIMRPIYYVSTLTIKNRIPCIVTILGGVLNVISMIILVKTTSMGAYAIVTTTAVIMLAINLLFNPLYGAHCISVNPIIFYKIIFKDIIACFLMMGSFSLTSYFLQPYNWVSLIFTSLILILEGALIYCFVMFRKKEIKSFLKFLRYK